MNNPASGWNYFTIYAYSNYSGLYFNASIQQAQLAQVATPVINPGGQSSTSPITVTISCSTSGATIRYTTNGNDPTSSSAIYPGAFTLSTSTTVKARAFKSGMTDSAVATTSYAIVIPSVTTLTNGSAVTGLSGAASSERQFKINVPTGQSKLEVKISGGTGDADLYVKRGSTPTTSIYDSRPNLGGNNETATLNNPASGDWYVMVRGFSAYSGLSLVATVVGSYQLTFDNPSIAALKVGTPVTISGTISSNGVPVANTSFGVSNGIAQQSQMMSTNSSGRFSFTSTPVRASVAIVSFTANGTTFASSSFQVLAQSASQSVKGLDARELRFKNSTSRTCKMKVTSPFGDTLTYTVPAGQTATLVKRNTPAFTLKPTVYGGAFSTVGIGAVDVTGMVTVDNTGVATYQVTAGGAGILRFSTYTTSSLNYGACWSPGGAIGAVIAGAELGADICIGSDGFTVGGSVGVGFLTTGFTVQLIEW